MEVSEELYPFEPNWLQLPGGARMHYVDEGGRDAPPVLMLHGNPTWSFYWRRLIEALAPTHRVIAPDHVGCGKSDKPNDDEYSYRLRQRIEDIETLVDHLGLENITLVLHDWGGMIGMGWAHRHPRLVSRLVLLNTAAFPMPSSKRLPAALRLARDTAVGAVLVRGLNAFARGATRLAVTRRKLPKEVRDALCAPYDSWDNRRAVLRFVQDIPLSDADPSFSIVRDVGEHLSQFNDRPTLICWGDRDFVFDDHFLRRWQEVLSNATVHRFADCSHYLLEDAPDEIEALVREFLGTQT